MGGGLGDKGGMGGGLCGNKGDGGRSLPSHFRLHCTQPSSSP